MTGANSAEMLPGAGGGEELLLSTSLADIPADAGDPAEFLDDEEDEAPRSRFGWLLAAIAVVAALGWIGGMLWLARPALSAAMPPVELAQFIAALCVPPALIGILWLLAQRNSRAEAHRFGETARAMRAEAAALERMVGALAARVESTRAALAEQTNILMAMGDGAAERLQAIANGMGQQARTVDASTRTLREAVTDAEKSVGVVLASLPKAHDEMRGLTERVEEAGLLASQHAAGLDAQLAALAERGRQADVIAGGAAERLAAHIARMDATSESAGARLEKVTEEMSAAVDGVLERAADAVDEARKGIAAQGEAMLAMLGANQAALDRSSRDTVEALSARIATIEEAIGRISERLGEQQGRGDDLFRSLDEGIRRTDKELSLLHGVGMERTQALSASVSALGQSFEAMGEAMRAGEGNARAVIATSEELLTALDASAREIDETLPAALDRLDARIAASRKVVAESKPELLALVTAAESTHDAIEAIADVVAQQRDTLAKTSQSLIETLETGRDKADSLEAIVDDAIATTRRFAETAAPQLVEALVQVRETATAAARQARETIAGIVPETAQVLEEAGTAALRRAVDSSVRRQLTELAETTEGAVSAATRASERLTQQMLALAETTTAVEKNIEAARAEQEKNDSDHFARRVSGLIEAMNSASIDITKAFSHEVSDSAWAAYLKGDRGVFTRRAVRLLDAGETRRVADLYDDDADFRDNVNRYIHDFEAMLRQILALREGSPLGVTLLSSDMGKLYVALAQAIERLRA